ncbi:MAG: hypothetical protein AAF386_00625 [Pseudomonadota bacterium]
MIRLTAVLLVCANAVHANPIVGMSPIEIKDAEGSVYRGMAWNDFERGRFCVVNETGHTCFGHFPAYFGGSFFALDFVCNDGAAGTSTMDLIDRVFLGHALLVPEIIQGTITGPDGQSKDFRGTFGETYLDGVWAIPCRGDVIEWEASLPSEPYENYLPPTRVE